MITAFLQVTMELRKVDLLDFGLLCSGGRSERSKIIVPLKHSGRPLYR
jgi:hypothetical protein